MSIDLLGSPPNKNKYSKYAEGTADRGSLALSTNHTIIIMGISFLPREVAIHLNGYESSVCGGKVRILGVDYDWNKDGSNPIDTFVLSQGQIQFRFNQSTNHGTIIFKYKCYG